MVSQIFAKYSDIQVEVTKEDLNTVVAQNPVFALKLELEATQRELRQAREQLARDATVLVDLQTELNTLKGAAHVDENSDLWAAPEAPVT